MAGDDELRLNELLRFRKTSRRLALEVHSHCEVPAGCGGVVLRWRRADAPIGLNLQLYVSGALQHARVDDQELSEQRVVVAPGAHLLTFKIDRPAPGGLLLFRAELNPRIRSAATPTLRSATDGRWRASVDKPGSGWRGPDFDDAAFEPLVEVRVSRPRGDQQWRYDYLSRDATGLGLPAASRWRVLQRPPRAVWVRCRFTVDCEGFR
ncbi:MAG: hypothetical protein H6713_20635 [Myxococcales bacterium]|nr:hypothetical protein [Myxococcales bacterium]